MRQAAIAIMLVLTTIVAGADEVTLRLDVDTVEQNEPFNVEFTYSGKLDGEPGFEVLEKDFQIISRNPRSSLEIINGNYRYELGWILTLLPKRTGKLTIPAVTFDKLASPEKTITVNASAPTDKTDLGDIFLETELTPQDGYVQGQYLFTVRIYFRGWLVDGDLSDPDIGSQDVVVQALGDPRRYSRFRNGERYQVYERKHALFPQSSGTLTIAPTYFSGRLRLPTGRNLLKRITAQGITAAVKPSPAAFSGAVWLPAENLEIEEVWPAETLVFEQGVPITRTFIIRATGLSSAQLPQLQLPVTDGVRVYPDQPATEDRLVDGGIMGVRTESVALVPQSAGELTLPEVTLAWWDTVNDRARIARVAARQITIAPSAAVQAAPGTLSEPAAAGPPLVRHSWSNPWLWATVVCALGWLLTLLRSPSGPAVRVHNAATSDSPVSNQALRTQLRIACRDNDAARCRELFNRYFFGDPLKTPTLGHLEQRLGADLAGALTELSRQLYGPGAGGDWRGGGKMWELIVKHEKNDKEPADTRKAVLQPL